MPYLLQQLLKQSATNFPNKNAVCYQDENITYSELEIASNKLALKLRDIGIKCGDRVGIYLDKSIVAIIAIFGILKSGAAYVPLDPNAPKKRIAFIINNCEIKTLISTSQKIKVLNTDYCEDLKSLHANILIDKTTECNFPKELLLSDILAKQSNQELSENNIENDLAYILYTSGSTGTPKGVMITHRAAMTFVDWAYFTIGLDSKDRVSNHAPLHFDLSIFDIFATIKAGGAVVLVPLAFSVFPRNLANFISEQQITVWYSVPSILIQLILHGQMERNVYSHLHTIMFAGEVFPIKYLKKMMQLLSDVSYYNLYGPTETNVCTYYKVPALQDNRMEAIPIGKACANTEIIVIDNNGKLVEDDLEGELCVRSPSLMAGYWKLPIETKNSCIEYPLSQDFRKEIMYRTGDIVKKDSDGNYIYIGRQDNMIKSRGYRIELGEIEHNLYKCPEVKEVAVIAIPDDKIGNKIKAFIVPYKKNLDKKVVESFCKEQIPKYMIPHLFEFVATLPKTSTDKIDKKELSRKNNENRF